MNTSSPDECDSHRDGGTGNSDGESVLAQLVAAQPLRPAEATLVRRRGWAVTRGRKYFRGQHHRDAAQFDILGDWRRDSEAWISGTPVASDLFAVTKALADGKSDKLRGEFDDALNRPVSSHNSLEHLR